MLLTGGETAVNLAEQTAGLSWSLSLDESTNTSYTEVMASEATEHQIGTLNEKSLHAALKEWYALPGDRFEVAVDGFVADIVRGEQLIEIQTRSFPAMKRKLRRLLPRSEWDHLM